MAVVLFATAGGLEPSADVSELPFRIRRALLPTLHVSDVLDAVRNVALFAGLGVVWSVTTRRPGRWRGVQLATLLGVAISVAVESLQLFSTRRHASVLDVVTNGSGALVGAWLTTLVIRAAAGRRAAGALTPAPAFLLTLPYVGAALCEAFSNWGRADAVPGAWGGPRTRFPVALAWSRAHLLAAPTWTDALLYLPAGALAALWLAERGMRTRRAAVAGALACALLWGMGECARGLAGGEMRPLAVLWRATWSALGATLAGAVAARPGWRARLLDTPPRAHGGAGVPLAALLYAGVILLWSLRPFLPETSVAAMLAKLTPEAFIPLSAQRDSYNLYSVADVAIGFLLYLPLGAWLCARPLRARGWLRGPLPGVWLAVAAELGQLFVARRVIDVTDVLVQAAGVACGWAVVRQADRARALAAQSALGNVSGGSASPSHAGARSSGATARVSSKW